MSQLYAQLASRPDPWLLGRTSAGLCTLQTACPLTVTYSGGSPAADTIAAGSAATVYGGSATSFDASADVWVVLTAPGSGALQVTKEADLATVVGDWAGLARIVQHAVEPYQPQAYLGAGGLGSGVPTTLVLASDTTALAKGLWNGSSNDAPPASWQTPGYDDSAWAHAIITTDDIITYVTGGHTVWATGTVTAPGNEALLRHHLAMPAGTITSVTLVLYIDYILLGLYVNGAAQGTVPLTFTGPPYLPVTYTIPPALLIPGADNVLAIWARDDAFPLSSGPPAPGNPGGNFDYTLTVDYSSTAGIASPGGTEGDLLYYHTGTWRSLPVGTSGQELTVVSGDPAWTDQPADSDTAGTVTSVQVAVPAPLSASGGPITASGTITLAWSGGQTANRVLASPDGSSGAVGLRALVGNDIPVDASTITSSAGVIKGNYQAGSGVSISGNTISATGSGGSVTSVALSLPGIFSVSGSPVTTAGTLSASLASQSPHTFWGGPASGGSAAPTFRALASSDLPKAAGAGGRVHAHGHFL